MGVKYLESYMENNLRHENGTKFIDLEDFIRKASSRTGTKSVVVVDGSSCMAHFYAELNQICGGQLKEFYANISNFAEMIYGYGGQLIVYFDGSHYPGKTETWIKRRQDKIKRTHKILDSLREDETGKSIKCHNMLTTLTTVARVAFKRTRGCDVRLSVKECDQEVVECARDTNAVAILSRDSDFLIYEGNFLYLSAKHLDFKNMTTKVYNQEALLKRLGLLRKQMAVFGTLVGNDILHYEDLADFHQKVKAAPRGRRPNEVVQIYEGVAQFVKDVPVQSISSILAFMETDKRSKKYFDNVMLEKFVESLRIYWLIANGPLPYLNTTGWEQLLYQAYIKHKEYTNPPAVFNVMSTLSYYCYNELEDLRYKSMPHIHPSLKPLRQRIYGILLHEKFKSSEGSVQEIYVNEEAAQEDNGCEYSTKVKIIYPTVNCGVPIWHCTSPSTKWQLFCSSISPRLKSEKVTLLQQHLIVPTLALYYLRHELDKPLLEDWEFEALIIQAVKAEPMTIEQIRRISVPKIDVRAIQIAAKFTRTCLDVCLLNAACGFVIPDVATCPAEYFDGVLFHDIYLKVKTGQWNKCVSSFTDHLKVQYLAVKSVVF